MPLPPARIQQMEMSELMSLHALSAIIALGSALYAAASIALWIGVLRSWRSLRLRRSLVRHEDCSPRSGAQWERHLLETPADAPPTVSVIVPARNEAASIAACVAALARQTYPRDRWELIVVDDRSDDGTGTIVAGLVPMLPIGARVIRIDQVPPGISPKKHAIATAIGTSSSDVILTTDADCRPEPGWIAAVIAALQGTPGKAPANLVAGYSPYGGRTSLAGRLLALETLSQAFLAMAGIGLARPITCTGRSFGYRRGIFEAVGGFGEALAMPSGDDHLFLQRAVARGFRATYSDAPGSHVWTDPPRTWKEFVQQRIRMYSGARRLPIGVAALGAFAWGWLFLLAAGMLALAPAAWACFGMKFAFDFVSLAIAAERLHERRLLAVYPLAAFLYLPYFLIFALLGTFGTYRWKGTPGR